MNSVRFESFVDSITSIRSLTYAEEKHIKNQRRKVKNRESAQTSREKKKNYITELEGEIGALKRENTNLSLQMKQLIVENKSLKEEVFQLQTLIRKTDLNIDIEFVKKPPVPLQNKKAAGIVLLVRYLSFKNNYLLIFV
jgi:predicted  nucleic acid-binding Zn-ribbon protein